MKKYTIVKKVLAKSIHDALKKESQEKPTEVFQDYTYVHVDTKKRAGMI